MTALLTACALACVLQSEWGLSAEDAQEHAWHAERAASERDHVDAELLLAVVHTETRFRATDVTRACKWGRCTWMCGVGQSRAKTKRQCYALQPLEAGYRELARELAWWIQNQHGDLRHAIAGHGCGYAKKGSRKTSLQCGRRKGKRSYEARVLESLRRIRARRVP